MRNLPHIEVPEDFFIQFYLSRGRSFPWRDEKTSPFEILIAEMLLKQTGAGKVAKVWPSMVDKYGNAEELAIASASDLYDMVAALGLGKQRSAALVELASALKQAGHIAVEPEELVKLPYVGKYTAHAVACFAFGRRFPIVDLSIVRVISRIAGIEPPKDIRRAPVIWGLAWSLLPQHSVKEHNYGLLDFAALVCKPKNPLCGECPLVAQCAYSESKSQCLKGGDNAKRIPALE